MKKIFLLYDMNVLYGKQRKKYVYIYKAYIETPQNETNEWISTAREQQHIAHENEYILLHSIVMESIFYPSIYMKISLFYNTACSIHFSLPLLWMPRLMNFIWNRKGMEKSKMCVFFSFFSFLHHYGCFSFTLLRNI